MPDAVKLTPDSQIRSIGRIGGIDYVNDVRIKALPCPKINNIGVTTSWKILDLISKAAALVASARAMQAAKMQDKIARRYFKLAKDQWDYFKKWYKPLEQQELNELHKMGRVVPDYSVATKGHDCSDTVFDSIKDQQNKLYNDYCLCRSADANYKLEMALSTVRGDSHNFARRYAEKLAQRKDDLRWNRKINAAARGRNLLPQSARFAEQANGLFGQYSQAMTGFAQQAASFSGYISSRQQTAYNGEHTQRIGTRLNQDTLSRLGYAPSAGYATIQANDPSYYRGNVEYSGMPYGGGIMTDNATSIMYDRGNPMLYNRDTSMSYSSITDMVDSNNNGGVLT